MSEDSYQYHHLPPPKSNAKRQLACGRPLPSYRGRYRGALRPGAKSEYVFLFYTQGPYDAFHIEATQSAETPEKIFDDLVALSEDRNMSGPIAPEERGDIMLVAGGTLDSKHLNFTLFNVPTSELVELVVRTFATIGPSESRITEFSDARIFVDNKTTEWGTVRDVLSDYGYPIYKDKVGI